MEAVILGDSLLELYKRAALYGLPVVLGDRIGHLSRENVMVGATEQVFVCRPEKTLKLAVYEQISALKVF